MKKSLLLILLSLFSIIEAVAQTSYNFELIRDSSDGFTVAAGPSASSTDANLSAVTVPLLIEKDYTLSNFTDIRGSGWSVVLTITSEQLTSLGLGDGTKDLLSISSAPSNDVFSHTVDPFDLTSFVIDGNPASGTIEILDNGNEIVQFLKNNGTNSENSILIDPQDGFGSSDRFNMLIGTTSYDLSQTLSNNSFTKSNFSLTPNPNKGQFTITSVAPIENSTLAIYNITGQEVYRTSMNTFGRTTFNVSLSRQLTAGAYLLKIDNGNASKILKFIVN